MSRTMIGLKHELNSFDMPRIAELESDYDRIETLEFQPIPNLWFESNYVRI